MGEEELFEYFWLCTVRGIGSKSLQKLTEAAGSVLRIKYLSEDKIISCIGQKRAKELLEALSEEKRKLAANRLTKIWERKITFLPLGHPDYPDRLRFIPDPPKMLFVKGRLPQKEQKQAALIGARACSAYGAQMARYFAAELAMADVGIVSGMARGIDSIAQEAALDRGQNSTAVLGCGVDICYPPENQRLYERLEKNGCLISEYLPGTQPQSYLFPPRNRIISGLADLVLVIEAREKSGTLITVDMALEQGRDVFAVPGRVQDVCSRGCNQLILHGAGIASSASVVVEALGKEQKKAEPQAESGENDRPYTKAVLQILGTEFWGIDEIANRIRLENNRLIQPPAMQELMQELLLLNMEGKVIREGGKYRRK